MARKQNGSKKIESLSKNEKSILEERRNQRTIRKWQYKFIAITRKLLSERDMTQAKVYNYDLKESDFLYGDEEMGRTSLGHYLNVSENARIDPITVERLLILCQILDCTPNDLLGYKTSNVNSVAIANEIGISSNAVNVLKEKRKLYDLNEYKEVLYKGKDDKGEYVRIMFTHRNMKKRRYDSNLKSFGEVVKEYRATRARVMRKPHERYFDVLNVLISYEDGKLIEMLGDYFEEGKRDRSITLSMSKPWRTGYLNERRNNASVELNTLKKLVFMDELESAKRHVQEVQGKLSKKEYGTIFYKTPMLGKVTADDEEHELLGSLNPTEYTEEEKRMIKERGTHINALFGRHYLSEIKEGKRDPFEGRINRISGRTVDDIWAVIDSLGVDEWKACEVTDED